MSRISKRVQNIVPSMTGVLKGMTTDMKRQGIDVISMSSGEPDFPTPQNIIAAAKKAMDDGHTKYTPHPGVLPLRQAICDAIQRENGISYKPEQICCATGAKQALINTMMVLLDPGDEVILPTPCWFTYMEQVKLPDGVPVLVPLKESEGFQLDLEAIERAVTPKTKAIVITNPSNPTGTVYDSRRLEKLAQMAEKHGLWIISDEIYKQLIYDDTKKFVSMAGMSDYAYDHTIIINGVSKTYAMTGWRLGYAASPVDIIKGMISLMGHVTSGPNSIAQYAAIEALNGPQESVEMMRREFNRRRIFLTERLNRMPGISCNEVQGAFYVMPNVSSYYGKNYNGKVIGNSVQFCEFILSAAHVAIIPGDSFDAPKNVRLTYACSMEDIVEGCDRIEKALGDLKG